MRSLLAFVLAWLLCVGVAHAYPATSNAGTSASTDSTVCTVAPCYSYQARNGKPYMGSPLAAAQTTVGDGSIGGCGTIVSASATGVGTAARWSAACTAGSITNQPFFNMTTRTPDAVSYTCPGGGTLSGTSCVCPEGYQDSGSACVEVVDPAQEYCTELSTNPAVGVSSPRPAGSVGLDSYTMCYSNQYSLYACSGTMHPDICGQGVDGKTHCSGKVTFSGSAPCIGTTQPQEPEDMPAPLPETPPPGQCPGEINGVAVYVPCSNTSSSGTKTNETTNSSGTTQTSETRNTTCTSAGICTTTVTRATVVNGGSPSTSTSTTTQPKGDFCAENPGSSECGQESSFSGTCQSAFVCQGDAVQCATAKAVNDQLCKLREAFQVSDDMDALTDRVLAGTEVADPKASAQVIDVGVFDQSNPLSSSCPADVPINLSGYAGVIPLSEFCHWLQLLGNMLVAVSLLGATIFVLRGA